MANPEHLKILEHGVEAWNEWRKNNPSIQPDLREAEFFEANLSFVDLSNADLRKAELLSVALHHANLSYADLSNASLFNTDLTSTDFSYANLSYTDLTLANINRARLIGTDLTNSTLGATTLGNIDFSQTKGLKSIYHAAASTIGIDTIYRSGGNIPESFLRGCGVPDDFIIYARSLVAQPIRFYSCFISYSSKDQDFAERLYADLQNGGVRCWFAPEDMKIGDKIRDRIDESIKLRDKLLLVLTESSIASDWVENEVESALEEERHRGRAILFPIRLDDALMDSNKAWAALIRRTRHVGDFTKWKDHDSYRKAFDRLLRDLKAEDKQAAEG